MRLKALALFAVAAFGCKEPPPVRPAEDGSVWLSFRAPRREGLPRPLADDVVVDTFAVHADGRFCIAALSGRAMDALDACRAHGTWCQGKLDSADFSALDELIARETKHPNPDNLLVTYRERRQALEYFLYVRGPRTELPAVRDPAKFYPETPFQAIFDKLREQSPATRQVVETLLDVRSRAAAAHGCSSPTG